MYHRISYQTERVACDAVSRVPPVDLDEADSFPENTVAARCIPAICSGWESAPGPI
jgi:hypothetical protein